MFTLIRRFAQDERGATAIEYGLIAAGISVAIITVVMGLGTKLNTTFESISSSSAKRPRSVALSMRPPRWRPVMFECQAGPFWDRAWPLSNVNQITLVETTLPRLAVGRFLREEGCVETIHLRFLQARTSHLAH